MAGLTGKIGGMAGSENPIVDPHHWCVDGSQLAQAHVQGTVISGVEVNSVLDGHDGWSF